MKAEQYLRMVNVTDQAYAYVVATRGGKETAASWFDVARAYDAGLESGIKNRQAGKRAIAKLPPKVTVWDTTGFRRRRP